MPSFIHWGADLGELSASQCEAIADAQVPAGSNAAIDSPIRSAILPMLDVAWQGRPALAGFPAPAPFALVDVEAGLEQASITLTSGALDLVLVYLLSPEGLLQARATVTNTAERAFELDELAVALPLPARASEILDFSGHWAGERRPQRTPVQHGAWLRESRHGRPGHDGAFMTVIGTTGFRFRAGEVWATHVGWSGSQRIWVERQASGISIVGAGELLERGEVTLGRGESYSTPWVYGAWSRAGLDDASSRFHSFIRREYESPVAVRPVILNTWEAVYFDHDESAIRRLADAGAEVGVERFVLDDGWMSGRTDDKRALGDWTVDRARWPDGLGALIGYVESLGMDFGLWVEPEMVSPDSQIAREHPEWILRDPAGGLPALARHQLVLDLAQPDAFAAVRDAMDALLLEYGIRYLKWDHNRDLLVRATHAQTIALYRLLDYLRERHPGVEIESCASGGGRIDLGILARTTRVWASDTNDPFERQSIYRYTSMLVPPELIGVHLGAPTAHTTGRTHSPSFRFATALFGWAGIEWDLTGASAAEVQQVAKWLEVYKSLRPIIHSGSVVRADRADPALWVHGVVGSDGMAAVYAVVAMAAQHDAIPAAVLLPGLLPEIEYSVSVVDVGAEPDYFAALPAPWMASGSFTMSGLALAELGFAAPPLAPEQAVVLHVTAVTSGG